MDKKPSLKDVARGIIWSPEFDLPSDVIDRALIEAGIDTNNSDERERFRNLVAANYHFQVQEELAVLGDYEAIARNAAGPNANESEILSTAWNAKRYADSLSEENRQQ